MNKVVDTAQFLPGETPTTWLLAQVKPNMLPRAQRNLENQGFEVFVPLMRETRRRNGRFVEKTGPLFPGYLFVEIDPASSPWRKINSTFGVSRLVSFAKDRPATVPRALVAELRRRFANDVEPNPGTLQPGTEVEILRGPFAGLIAKVEQTPSKDRIWLLLDVLGRETRISTVGNRKLRLSCGICTMTVGFLKKYNLRQCRN